MDPKELKVPESNPVIYPDDMIPNVEEFAYRFYSGEDDENYLEKFGRASEMGLTHSSTPKEKES